MASYLTLSLESTISTSIQLLQKEEMSIELKLIGNPSFPIQQIRYNIYIFFK